MEVMNLTVGARQTRWLWVESVAEGNRFAASGTGTETGTGTGVVGIGIGIGIGTGIGWYDPRMVKIYTKTGDAGETSLFSGGRVSKDHPLVEAYGSLDELNSVLGLLLCEPLPDGVEERLGQVQNSLFEIGSAMADRERRSSTEPGRWATGHLEQWIDGMEDALEPLTTFILPGGSRAAALAHLSRTVCRRAERRIRAVPESDLPAGVLAYVNRLSDALFVLARSLNARLGIVDRAWRAEARRDDVGNGTSER